jgi:BirA family biotin operon repressor/biotin-[acetyl-CoA-carboxylase] ligase
MKFFQRHLKQVFTGGNRFPLHRNNVAARVTSRLYSGSPVNQGIGVGLPRLQTALGVTLLGGLAGGAACWMMNKKDSFSINFQRQHFQEIDSTQTYLKKHADRLLGNGDCWVISAEEQSAGKGTHNRVWISPPKVNIYATFGFKLPDELLKNITKVQNDPITVQIAALAVAKVVEEFGLEPKIKWRNDLRVDGKKICGILCELVEGEKGSYGIIGIGLNVNMPQSDCDKVDQPVTSMKLQLGSDVDLDKEEIFLSLQKHLSESIENYLKNGIANHIESIKSMSEFMGDRINVENTDTNQLVSGVFESLTPKGGLMLRLDNGELQVINSGRIIVPEKEAQQSLSAARP